MSETITWLFAAALFQNVLLTTGFGSSLILRVLNKKSDIWKFGALFSFFLIATMAIDYPIDLWIGMSTWAKLWRPVTMVVITTALYGAFTLTVATISVPFYKKVKPYVVPAAFNNLTLGLAMIANHKVALTFWSTLALAVGTCIGFMLMGWLLLEGRDRMNHDAVPDSFKGAPLLFLYLGIMALALLAFGGSTLL